MELHISPESGQPIYKQIVEQAERLILGGTLTAGELLPSVRKLASELTVNPMTISNAYSQLEAKGLVIRLRGKGMAVANVNSEDTVALLTPLIEALFQQAAQLNIDADTLLLEIKKQAK